jgi:hypothetical protein
VVAGGNSSVDDAYASPSRVHYGRRYRLSSAEDAEVGVFAVAGWQRLALEELELVRRLLRAGGEDLLREHWPGPEQSLLLVQRLAYGRPLTSVRLLSPHAALSPRPGDWALKCKSGAQIGDKRTQFADSEPIGPGRKNPSNCRDYAAVRGISVHD